MCIRDRGNSIFVYNTINELIVARLQFKENSDDLYNQHYRDKVEAIRDVIYYFYHGGSTYNTPFWIQAAAQASKELDKSESFKKLKKNFKYYSEIGIPYRCPGWVFESFCIKIIDEQMGYNYLK